MTKYTDPTFQKPILAVFGGSCSCWHHIVVKTDKTHYQLFKMVHKAENCKDEQQDDLLVIKCLVYADLCCDIKEMNCSRNQII